MELKVDNIFKTYNKKKGFINNRTVATKNALSEISFTLTEGIYGLIGANGAGKSTLMNIIVGNLKPDAGEIRFNEQEITKLGKEYKSLIGYMPQQQWMYENMSCVQFLAYMAALKGMTKASGKQRINQVLEFVNLEDERNKKIGALSGGMKQRLLLAQSILNDPSILILDEPTAGVDPNERIRIRNLISQISFHKIVIIATHIVPDIEFISNEFLFIKEGRLIFHDKLDGLMKSMDDKVWEVNIDINEIGMLEKSYPVVSLLRDNEIIKARIVTEEFRMDYNGYKVRPTLEDLFVLYGGK